MNTLFCTPEQGARLLDLLPELDYTFAWGKINRNYEWEPFPKPIGEWSSFIYDAQPALTLQEIRDVAMTIKDGKVRLNLDWERFNHVQSSTAPELAQWVIARLEDHP